VEEIPYIGSSMEPSYSLPDLNGCTRVVIQYKPSMNEYFFPYTGQQNLFNTSEKQYLQSSQEFIVDNQKNIKTLIDDICKSRSDYFLGETVCEDSLAHVTCYRDSDKLTSFNLYDNITIETEEKQRIVYMRNLRSLQILTPKIPMYMFRVQCADNLNDLWYRLRLYKRAAKSLRIGFFKRRIDTPYPDEKKWCDYIVMAYKDTGMLDRFVMKPFRCPGAGEGKNHYAMNPNCEPNSPGDMVLLFETKAGWNQHGGPELFTFDNHDPKGGCVLLNDGTVKFIRTQEELQALKWK
jgi:hypothetical protein